MDNNSKTSMVRSVETLRRVVERFIGNEPIKTRLVTVLAALPSDVLEDLLDDSRFRIAMDDYKPGRGRTVWMSCPEPGGSVSRCIVLKRRLADAREDFAHYVIAHELAHAYLRNGAWGKIADPEQAADALAASWGFGKPH
jgi:hypothetical protein